MVRPLGQSGLGVSQALGVSYYRAPYPKSKKKTGPQGPRGTILPSPFRLHTHVNSLSGQSSRERIINNFIITDHLRMLNLSIYPAPGC